MQYLLIIYEDEKQRKAQPPEEMGAMMGRYFALNDALKAAGAFVAGDALEPIATATTVRVRNGKAAFTDGPFAETMEQLGGYYLIEAENLDEALKWAAQIPAAETGSVEVRPIMVLPGHGAAK